MRELAEAKAHAKPIGIEEGVGSPNPFKRYYSDPANEHISRALRELHVVRDLLIQVTDP